MANKKRSNGEGCFYQLKDRSWVHQITLGRKDDGTLERKSFKGKTKQICIERKEKWRAEHEAQKQQAELQESEELYRVQQRIRLGHSLESEELFSEAFMNWLKLYKSPPSRKPSTYAATSTPTTCTLLRSLARCRCTRSRRISYRIITSASSSTAPEATARRVACLPRLYATTT